MWNDLKAGSQIKKEYSKKKAQQAGPFKVPVTPITDGNKHVFLLTNIHTWFWWPPEVGQGGKARNAA